MPKTRLVAASRALCVTIRPARAVKADYQTQGFPSAHELSLWLQADPSDPHFSFEFGFPVQHQAIARINVGDYLGIYRWALGDVGALQLNIGGAINTRFDATTSHNLQVIDFYGNVPLDLRIKWFSMRTMFYHDSSHLGDDYLRENNIQDMNNSWEAWRDIISIQPFDALRFYGGYQQAIHTKPDWEGRRSFQAGTEIYFNSDGPRLLASLLGPTIFKRGRARMKISRGLPQLGFKNRRRVFARSRHFVLRPVSVGSALRRTIFHAEGNDLGFGIKIRALRPSLDAVTASGACACRTDAANGAGGQSVTGI